jgi:predicted exporter
MFRTVYELIRRRRLPVLIMLLSVTAVATAGLFFIPFEDSLDPMLPDDSDVLRASQLLREANLAGKVVLELSYTGNEPGASAFLQAVDELAGILKPPWVSRVITAGTGQGMLEDVRFFVNGMPFLINSDELVDMDLQISPQGVRRHLKQTYRELLKPQGSFMASMARHDPLHIGGSILARIQTLSSSFGYRVRIRDGHFVSEDGRHAMLILETPISLTDNTGAQQLLAYIEGAVAQLPPWISASIICGHQHTVSNQKIVKQDIQRTFIVAAIVFLLLFFLFFRDIRAVFVFIIPVAAVVVAINIGWLFMGRIAMLIVGLSAFIAGIAIDYGIHLFMAVRTHGSECRVIQRVARPTTLGALTTVGVFVAFLFSRIPGYRQLGLISLTSIIISLVYAVFVLPFFLKKHNAQRTENMARSWPPMRFGRRVHIAVIAVFAILLARGLVYAPQVTFDSDLAHLDGTAPAILEAENRFFETWGRGVADQGLFVVKHSNCAQALEINDQVYRAFTARMPQKEFANFAMIWPSPGQQQSNRAAWTAFWQDGREKKLRALLKSEGDEFGFSDEAFEPFFEALYPVETVMDEPQSNRLFAALKERFVQDTPEGVQLLSFFPDTEEVVAALAAVNTDPEHTFLISRKVLYRNFSQVMKREITRIAFIAIGLVILTMLVFIRDIRMALVGLIPALTGVVGMLSVINLLNHPLNAANLIAGIVVIGLCIDYGIFIIYACRRQVTDGTGTAVSLSAVTTLAGAGVLLFANHPALYSVGLTLLAGVGSGYITAILVVPSLCVVFGLARYRNG